MPGPLGPPRRSSWHPFWHPPEVDSLAEDLGNYILDEDVERHKRLTLLEGCELDCGVALSLPDTALLEPGESDTDLDAALLQAVCLESASLEAAAGVEARAYFRKLQRRRLVFGNPGEERASVKTLLTHLSPASVKFLLTPLRQ